MSTAYLHPQGTRVVFGPQGLCVRVDSPQRLMIIWDGGYKAMDIASVPSSWQVLQDDRGGRLPVRIKRTVFPGFSHGANSVAVEFN